MIAQEKVLGATPKEELHVPRLETSPKPGVSRGSEDRTLPSQRGTMKQRRAAGTAAPLLIGFKPSKNKFSWGAI
jgi:hypothetical protein